MCPDISCAQPTLTYDCDPPFVLEQLLGVVYSSGLLQAKGCGLKGYSNTEWPAETL